MIIAGDFNAVVGQRVPGDIPKIIGEHGVGERNDRGQRMLEWATSESMVISNTHFRKLFEKQWSHHKGEVERLIDY